VEEGLRGRERKGGEMEDEKVDLIDDEEVV
jgi:hypothetical protein